jgi:hypothetical protein
MTVTDPAETAWRIHAAVTDWTGKVDGKATFALTIESAVLAGLVALSGSQSRFGHLTTLWPALLFWVGVTLLAIAIVLSVLVVSPRTRDRKVEAEWPDNFVYFGHLKHWDPDALADELRQRDPLPILTRQLVVMSRIAATKHRRVQESLIVALVGAFLVASAGIIA